MIRAFQSINHFGQFRVGSFYLNFGLAVPAFLPNQSHANFDIIKAKNQETCLHQYMHNNHLSDGDLEFSQHVGVLFHAQLPVPIIISLLESHKYLSHTYILRNIDFDRYVSYDFGISIRASRFFRVLPKLRGMAVYGGLGVVLKPPAQLH